MLTRPTRILLTGATAVALLGGGAGSALARHGADDPAGHDRRDDRVAHHDRRDDRGHHHRHHHHRHGADDGAAHR